MAFGLRSKSALKKILQQQMRLPPFLHRLASIDASVTVLGADAAVLNSKPGSKRKIINTKYNSPQAENPLFKHLLFSTEVDVFLTVKRGPIWLERQYQIQMQRKNELRTRQTLAMEESLPVALQYLYGGSAVVQKGEEGEDVVIEGSLVGDEESVIGDKGNVQQPVYPYGIFDKVDEENDSVEDVEKIIMANREKCKESDSAKSSGRRRRTKKKDSNNIDEQDFEVIKDDLGVPEVRKLFTEDHLFKFGTPNPDSNLTDVPCGGCGALLHCMDPKLPGYAPSQVIDQREEEDLRSLLCQRCYVIQEYDVALKVNVSPEDYPRTLEHIKDQKALVILMVDLLDFPGSVWPDIMDVLGKNKSVILVGNKIDLILPDSKDYIKRITRIIRDVLLTKCWGSESGEFPHIIDTICLSAKTGFNVENLLAKVFSFWKSHHNSLAADIYIVGSTNVGKSSLFNLLVDSDLCKIKAVDLVQKAITSPVPGTTLSLLKFPVTRPEPHFIRTRTRRLAEADRTYRGQELARMEKLRTTKSVMYAVPGMYNITHTLKHSTEERRPVSGYLAEIDMTEFEGKQLPTRLDPTHEDFAEGKWCYDTPGTVCHDQIINLLTAEEIAKTLASTPLRPRTYLVREGHSVLLGGLARLDYTVGKVVPPILITVFCSDTLPINIVETKGVEDFLKHSAGSDLQMVPSKENKDRLPELLGKEVYVKGEDWSHGAADIVLSSAGWVMVTPRRGEDTTFVGYTPGGKGITTRPPFLPHSIHQRGFRIKGAPAYNNDRVYTL